MEIYKNQTMNIFINYYEFLKNWQEVNRQRRRSH